MSMDLATDFEADLRDALLDDAADTLTEDEALFTEFVALVHERLRSYGKRHGYDVESTIESQEDITVTRERDRLSARVVWASGQMARWEFGVSPHLIEGNPVLSFVWQDPPQWVREEFDQARGEGGQFASGWRVFLPEVDHPGIPESRAIRDSIAGLRRLLR